MKKWYFLVLVCSGIGGWFAYPHAYPKIIAFIEEGRLPWSRSDSPGVVAGEAEAAASIAPEIAAEPVVSRASAPRGARPLAAAPEFAPIEEIVGAWKAIPDSAFPRKIRLRAPVTYQIAGGTGTLAAGSDVVALSASDTGVLTVAPNEKSTLQGQVPIDQTDFKEVLTAVYDRFKERKLAQFNAAQTELAAAEPEEEAVAPAFIDKPSDPEPGMATGANTPMPAKPANIDAKTRAIIGEPPLQYVEGTVPAMVRSMESGQVTEIRQNMIQYWGRIHFDVVQGEPYWVGRVDYTASSIFGIFPTQAKALMRQGKVVKWIYTGSEEPVP